MQTALKQSGFSSSLEKEPASFRDPSGFVFRQDGTLYRWVAEKYRPHYDLLVTSGLLEELQDKGMLVTHREVTLSTASSERPYKILQPQVIPFISYPQEWSFSQLKDAALLTLDIAVSALSKGMVLKDASAYNVQFVDGKPIFIDTLSFESYVEGTPWVAYRQFCQHFLAPLALMALVDVSLGKLLGTFIDGIPLDVAAKMLPWKTKLSGLMLHIHLHSRSQQKYSDKSLTEGKAPPVMSKTSLLGLLDGLTSSIRKLSWKPEGTEWAEYYSATNYSEEAMSQKGNLVREFSQMYSPKMVWDLGANTGVFSHIAAQNGAQAVSFDIDAAAVERHYQYIKAERKKGILPLVLDLTNPTGNYGWAGEERSSLADRGPVDVAMALALIHHLAISNNVPLSRVAGYFAALCKHLIIEFVPKSDSQVVRLLKTREDIFPSYTEQGFEEAFSKYFTIRRKEKIAGSERTLYAMDARGAIE